MTDQPKVTVELSKELLVACQYLIYDAWSKAYDNTKEEAGVPTTWKEQEVHAERLKNNNAELQKWERLKAEITKSACER
jgi:hypothetical protein